MNFKKLTLLACCMTITTYANTNEAYSNNQLAQQQVVQAQLKAHAHQEQMDIATYQNLSNQIYAKIDIYQKQENLQLTQLNQLAQQLQALTQKYKTNCAQSNKTNTCQNLVNQITPLKQEMTSLKTQSNQTQAQLRVYLGYAQELEQKSVKPS